MPTVYEILSEFSAAKPGFEFSKKKRRLIAGIIKSVYDKNPKNKPIQYVTSSEGEMEYSVRDYPETFRRTMQGIVLKIHTSHIDNVIAAKVAIAKKAQGITPTKKKQKKVPRGTMQKPVEQNRQRVRFTNKPLYSSKPNKNQTNNHG